MNPSVFEPGRPSLQDALNRVFSGKVFDSLDEGVRECLLDYMALRRASGDYIVGPNSMSDYSYLIVHAFKALEGFLLQVARNLGIDPKEYDYKIGQMLQEENVERLYKDIISKLEKVDKEKKLDIKIWLNNARIMLKSYRHTPAHYLGAKIPTYEKAIHSGDYILETIDRMGIGLLEAGLLKKSQDLEAIEDVVSEK